MRFKIRKDSNDKQWHVTAVAGNNRVWKSATGYNTKTIARASVKSFVAQIQAGKFTVE